MVYTSRFSYNCGKLFPVSRNLKEIQCINEISICYAFLSILMLSPPISRSHAYIFKSYAYNFTDLNQKRHAKMTELHGIETKEYSNYLKYIERLYCILKV